MLTPGEIWPMLAAAGLIVFGAGGMAVKIRNGTHVSKEVCQLVHSGTDEHLKRIDKNLDRIWRYLNGQPLERVGDDEPET